MAPLKFQLLLDHFGERLSQQTHQMLRYDVPMRSDYKGVWTTLSESLSSAKMHVGGTEDEAVFETSGAGTTEFLLNKVGIAPTDVVLKIGCGVGRVGKHLAQHCRR